MNIKRWFYVVIVLLLFATASFSQEAVVDMTSLKNVDYITVSGYIKDGDLLVTIVYKNMATGEPVHWKEGKVKVECEVYENIGDTIEKKKGQRIAIASKNITNSEQDMTINIPRFGKDKRGLIYCSIDTGYKKTSARGDFWFN